MSTTASFEQQHSERVAARKRGVRLEWASILFALSSAALIFLVMGNSQAMRTALFEDLLSLIPPVAFLITARLASRRPTDRFPYGYHRSSEIGHLISATALAAMGVVLVVEGVSALLAAERPSVGTFELFGHPVWQGWLMIAVMVYAGAVPAVLGHLKLKVAPIIHDKALYADAKMDRADWMSSVAVIVGILGVGVGLWWADAAAALAISVSILKDGGTNLRAALRDLMEGQATTVDNGDPSPIIARVYDELERTPWISGARVRVRDMGHDFSVDARVRVPPGRAISAEDFHALEKRIRALDEAIEDVVVMPVTELPAH